MEKEEIVSMAEFIANMQTNFNNLRARAQAIFDSRDAQPVVFTDESEEDSENE